jgi:predicted ATP-dependent serine protease
MSLGVVGDFMRKPLKQCSRCGLKFPKNDEQCLHCSHIKNAVELQKLKETINDEIKSNSKVGSFFLLIALILGLLLFLASS